MDSIINSVGEKYSLTLFLLKRVTNQKIIIRYLLFLL